MCLALGVVASILSAAMKWAGAFVVPSEFLYGFYEQSPLFGKIHGQTEFAYGQFGLLFLATAATALAIASIPHPARRFVIVLGAVLITFFLSPVLALMGWKLEPFSWLTGILSASLSALFVFPGQALPLKEDPNDEDVEVPAHPQQKKGKAIPQPSAGEQPRLRTPEMAIAAAVKKSTAGPAATTADAVLEDVSVAAEDEMFEAMEVVEHLRSELCVVMCSVFPPRDAVDGYSGAARAFLERVGTFLKSAGASDTEVGPDFVRATFEQKENAESAHEDVVAACRAALLLYQHLMGYREAGDSTAARELRFGISVEAIVLDGDDDLPLAFKIYTRTLSFLNRRYGSHVVLGARAHRLSGAEVEVRPLEMMDDPDSGLPVEVYELVGLAETFSDEERELRDAFWEGVVCLRSNLKEEALKRFRDARPENANDPVLAYFEAVARGEAMDDDWQDSAAALDHGDDVIPAVFLRESDLIDAMEMFVDDFEDSEPDPVNEKR